jgi:poly(3-hydroxybutyrate) depolymerase
MSQHRSRRRKGRGLPKLGLALLSCAVLITTAAIPSRQTPANASNSQRTVTISGAARASTADLVSIPDTQRIMLPNGRYYFLAKPTGSGTVPLVIVLHGWHNTALSIASGTEWGLAAASKGFALVYGQGVDYSWNSGNCCGSHRTDDIQYLIDLVHSVERQTSIDTHRIYVSGFSNGAMMALYAACARPDIFAAVGAMSGTLTVPCRPRAPTPERALAVLQINGALDHAVPDGGGYSPVTTTSYRSSVTEGDRLPAGTEYQHIVLPRLKHAWATFANSGFDAVAAMWMFFAAHRLS